MAALRVAGRRAASYPFCTMRSGGGDTGLALYAASNGKPLRTLPTAFYRGDPSPFHCGGRWAALITRGVRTPSTLAARPTPTPTPTHLLRTGAGAVCDKITDDSASGDKIRGSHGGSAIQVVDFLFPATGDKVADPLFLATGDNSGGPLLLGTGSGDVHSKIADALSLGTGGKIGGRLFPVTGGGAVHSKVADPFFLATGDKTCRPRCLGTGVGAVGRMQISATIMLPRYRGPWPATSGLLSNSVRNGLQLLRPFCNPSSICAVRPVSTGPSKNDQNSFSKLWTIEKKVGICAKLIKDAHKSAVSYAETMMEMMENMSAEQARILSTTKGVMTFKRLLLWSPLLAVIVTLIVSLAGLLGAWWFTRFSGYEQCKSGFTEFVISIVHQVLQDPTIKRDAQPHADMGYDAVRRAVDPAYRWWQWWKKGTQVDVQIFSAAQFSDKATSFAFVVMTLLSSSDNNCDEEHLMEKLKYVGFDQKETNVAMLNFLIKKGYLTKETKIDPHGPCVFYHSTEDALKECITGVMKNNIIKAVKNNGTLDEMLK